MAKAKKKEFLTIEERLKAALVPEDEQPYEVPENWCWTYINQVATVIMGQSPDGESTTDDENETPLIGGAADMGELYPSISRYTKRPTKLSVDNDLILCIRATFGKPIFSNGKYCLGRGVAAIRSAIISKELLRYFYLAFEQYLYDNATGTTFAQVTGKVLENMPFPLPPLSEQHRIVSHIESFFSQLNEARDKAQEALDGFDNRKDALLHKAFIGELSERWRKDNKVSQTTWKRLSLGECLLPMVTKKPSGPTFRYIDIESVDNKRQVISEPKTIATEDAPSRASRGVESGNVLFSMVRPYLKNIAMVEENMNDCIASTGFYVCRCKENIRPLYLFEYLCSKDAIDYVMQFMKGDNSPSIRKDDLLGMEINLPSLLEQDEICRIVNDFVLSEQKEKDAIISVLSQIELIKKSILAKAFRGELGTNDPEEESAIGLIKEILQDSNALISCKSERE